MLWIFRTSIHLLQRFKRGSFSAVSRIHWDGYWVAQAWSMSCHAGSWNCETSQGFVWALTWYGPTIYIIYFIHDCLQHVVIFTHVSFVLHLIADTQKQVERFIQFCIFPRVLNTTVDAFYCAKMIHTMHKIKTPNFGTLIILDRVRLVWYISTWTLFSLECKNFGLSLMKYF